MALSAGVVTASPGAAWAIPDITPSGWVASAVRFEALGPGSGGLTVAGTGSFRGAVEVRRNGRSLAVVNHLGLEDYVRGIDEVPPSWPPAVLQAQAIAARTYAAHLAASRLPTWQAVGADICATARCQVYRGLDAERKAKGHGWLPAVEATAGRVLLEAGRPILASYSAAENAPRSMSQNGALVMAMEGHSANDILSAYYGIRPTSAPSRIPATVRVALDTDAAAVRVSAAQPFRVLDGSGNELAASAEGEWKVAPTAKGVRVVPPKTYREPSAVETVGAEAAVLPASADVIAAAVRRPARVITATAELPLPVPWALTAALAVLLVAGAATATFDRRRRA